MATTMTSASARISLKWLYENVLDVGNSKDQQTLTKSFSVTDGEGANQFEGIFRDDRSVATSTEDALDFYGTALQDAFGNNIAAKAVKWIYIENTGTVRITWGGNAAEIPYFAAVNDKLGIEAGGCNLWVAPTAAGIAVTATTGDILSVTNTSGATVATYRIVVGYTK